MAEVLPTEETADIFDPADNIIRVEFNPRPAVPIDYRFNQAQEINLYRFRTLFEEIIGTIRADGFGITYNGSTLFTIAPGTLFYRELRISLASGQNIAKPVSTEYLYAVITISRMTLDTDPGEIGITPPGSLNTFSGPNLWKFDVTFQTFSSTQTETDTTWYVLLATLESDGSFVEHVPILGDMVGSFCSDANQASLDAVNNVVEDVLYPTITVTDTVAGTDIDLLAVVNDRTGSETPPDKPVMVHWWISGTQYGSPEAMSGTQVLSLTNGNKISPNPIVDNDLNHCMTDSSGQLLVNVTNSHNATLKPYYFHVAINGKIYVDTFSVYTATV